MEISIYLACLLGILSRIFFPYLILLRDNPETSFDRKYLVPAIISVLINLLAAPLILNQLAPGGNWINAWIIGYGATDVSRDFIKATASSVPALSPLK